MTIDFDVIIIGSGPSGVSVAFPLVEAGLKVLMLDQGESGENDFNSNTGTYRSLRENEPDQWKRFIGEDYAALKMKGNVSPKLKVPQHRYVFDGFKEAYSIATDNFEAVGSLAQGGLSNAWGAGTYVYDAEDLQDYPISPEDLQPSYQAVGERIGISGSRDDDLGAFYGADVPLQPPVDLDENMAGLFKRYNQTSKSGEVRLGRARNAVLTTAIGDRQACQYTNRCLWSCPVGSIYSASFDLRKLRKFNNFTYQDNAFVQGLAQDGDVYQILFGPVQSPGSRSSAIARKVILAAGTIGSTKLALEFLGHTDKEVSLYSNPAFAIAFLNWRNLGSEMTDEGFALGQLGFSVEHVRSYSHGVLFSASSIAVSELTKYMPFSYVGATAVARLMMPAMLFANCFLSSSYSQHKMKVTSAGAIELRGAYTAGTDETVADLGQKISKKFRQLGAFALGKPVMSKPGADIHYCGTLPMSDKSASLPSTSSEGLIFGTAGLYVVDGAVLPSLPAKNPTFSIMANADRIGHIIARDTKF